MSRKPFALLLLSVVVALAAGCSAGAPAPAPVPPTKTPKPTFTPTPDWTPTSIAFLTVAPEQATVAPVTTEAQPQATGAPAEATGPTAEPTSAVPEETQLTASQNVNVRSGPGTAYPAIGRLTTGQSFPVVGRNDAGDWVKFDFNGRDGWVTAALVTVAGDLNGVKVAQAPAIPTTAAAADGTTAAGAAHRAAGPDQPACAAGPPIPVLVRAGLGELPAQRRNDLLQRLRALPQ